MKLHDVFELQRSIYSPANPPSYDTRMDRITRVENISRNHYEEITIALQNDFGCRHSDLTFLSDILPQLSHAKHVKKHLKQWMKKEKTSSGLMGLTGQRSYIVNEPLGVIGVISPFNAPVSLAFDPTIDAVAAGNTVMIKISENVPETASLISYLVEQYFEPHELAVIVGDTEVSKEFVSMPWDKLLFTGGSEIGKKILASTAKNLTPVILELGGKSPCVILEDANIEEAAEKIAKVRLMNAGQVCISGDYVFLPENHLKKFIDCVLNNTEKYYPSVIENNKFTSVINNRAYDRINEYIQEAINEGCQVIQSNPLKEKIPDRKTRKIPLTLVINPPDNLNVATTEIFGPILSIFTYNKLEETITYINAKRKPLALYIFGKNRKDIDKVIGYTSSGGVTVNDLLMHADAKEMGFGGVGYSGMGRYKGGIIGYKAFSNQKSVVEQGFLKKFTHGFIPPIKSNRERKILKRQLSIK